MIALCCVTCTDSSRANSDQKSAEWKIGYWYWPGWGRTDKGASDKGQMPINVLYVRTGEYHTQNPYNRQREVYMSWPEFVPRADIYIAVFRCEGADCLSGDMIPNLIKSYEGLKVKTRIKGQKLVGLQIDYDCATVDLTRYGRFLQGLKKVMLKDDLLSITTLLDWFNPKTTVSDVVNAVDEFVPQFYDVDYRKLTTAEGGIAEPIDPARWAPIFNAYRKRYRIGIATFGRILSITKAEEDPSYLEDMKRPAVWGQGPLEILVWNKGTFVLDGTSTAGEAIAQLKGGDRTLFPISRRETIKMIIPTQRSVASAYRAAKAMGGFCSGVVFFRYPIGDEAMVLSPDEVGRVVSGEDLASKSATVEADNGFCVAVSCSDLFIRLKERFPSNNVVLTIQSSHDLEYFVPGRLVQARPRGSRLIDVSIPAFAGSPRILVGRAVSRDPVQFTVEEKQ